MEHGGIDSCRRAMLMSGSDLTGRVRIVHGPRSLDLHLQGHTVGFVRKHYQARFNFAPDASALVNGVKVGDETVLQPADILEFIHERGRKGIGEVFTDEEFIRGMKITREVFDRLVEEGLPVLRMPDGTYRITETQANQFLDRRAGLPISNPSTITAKAPESTGSSPYLDAKRAAAYLGISEKSLYGLVERGHLAPLRGPRGRYRFTREMLDDYLALSVKK